MREATSDGEALPELRQELQLLPGAADEQGQPTWLIHDPLLNRFTQIDRAAYEVLRHWGRADTVGQLIERVNQAGGVVVDGESIAAIVRFLAANELSAAPLKGGWRSLAGMRRARRHGVGAVIVHNYLFFKLPLVRPQAFLERTLPLVRPLGLPITRWLVLCLGLAGLYLTSRQWDDYVNTLQSYLTWEGALVGAVALVAVKIVHELGHAYTAVAFGCRVHTMGLAFMVMAPMPYTDVTDAWRLTDRRKRLVIDGAGMATELAVAAVALFLWAFLPQGPLKSAAFVLSSVSAASSLAINLNPFMRFDGYYLLSGWLGVDNLQARSFEVGCWRMREILFGLGAPCPEPLPRRLVTFLAIYAWAVWLYRLALFIGIALLVYHYFFKVLGVVLFIIEIIYFVARPIWGELMAWYRMRQRIVASRRSIVTCCVLVAAALLCIVPWSTRVEIPSIIESAQLQVVHATRNARIEAVHVRHGSAVRRGEPIITLSSSDIEHEVRRTKVSLQTALLQHGRRLSDATDREMSLVLESAIEALRTRLAGLERERVELEIIAPFDGVIVDINPEVHPGRWINTREPIATISGGETVIVRGYAEESDAQRLASGAPGVFIPEHPLRARVGVRIERVAPAGSPHIEIADLASINSGRINVVVDERRRLVPETSQFLVAMAVLAPLREGDLAVRGVVLAQGRAESLAARVWRRTLAVLVRESGA